MKPKPRRDGGLAIHFSAMLILAAATPALAAAAADLSDLRFGVAAAACGLVSIGLFGYTLLRDTWNAAMVALVASMTLSVFVWPYILIVGGFDLTSWMSRVGMALATLGTLAAAYLTWRRWGRERAEDFLNADDSAQEIDGIALRWTRKQSAPPGTRVLLAIELQNAWNTPARCRVRLTVGRRYRAHLRVARDSHTRLAAGEYGILFIPVEVTPDASGRYQIRLGFTGRPESRFGGRLRLRPKPTLPVGPMSVMTILAAVSGKLVDYRGAVIDLDVTPETDSGTASAAPLPAKPKWERLWVPDPLGRRAHGQSEDASPDLNPI